MLVRTLVEPEVGDVIAIEDDGAHWFVISEVRGSVVHLVGHDPVHVSKIIAFDTTHQLAPKG